MRILLAPMEGLVDDLMRELLTSMGGIDQCVTEFVRVTSHLLPSKTFYRLCPELLQGGRTAVGVPVSVQLLGSDPACLADNAARAAELGALAVDLNFGCPAPTVNRHCGGAVRFPVLALSMADDELMTLRGTHNLVNLYANTERRVESISPAELKVRRIGHFGFFRDQFRQSLWPRAVAAVMMSRLPAYLGR